MISLYIAPRPVSDIYTRLPCRHSPSNEDLEGGRILTTSEDTKLAHTYYSYIFNRKLRASWKLFGFCALVVSRALVYRRGEAGSPLFRV